MDGPRDSATSGRPRLILRLRRRFAAPPERVFQAWTEPAALRRWWCPPGWSPAEIAVDLREGGSWRIAMRHDGDGSLVGVGGQFLEVRAARRLVYTWRWEGAFPEMRETCVTVMFADADGGTDLTLTHEPLPDSATWVQHRSGWLLGCDRMDRFALG